MNLVGEPYNHYNMEVFLLEAKAVWEHTCIAGGLFLLSIQKNKGMINNHSLDNEPTGVRSREAA